jgi:plasmid maintenance system antidote protein VapI
MSFKPSPPGDTIKDIMEERGISNIGLQTLLNLSEGTINDLLSGECNIDRYMAIKLSNAIGSTPEFWENREHHYREAQMLMRGDPK